MVLVAFLGQCVTEDVHSLTAYPAEGHFLAILFPTPNTLPLLALNPSQMYNLKSPPAVMLTMISRVRPAGQPGMSHLPYSKYNFYFQFRQYLV